MYYTSLKTVKKKKEKEIGEQVVSHISEQGEQVTKNNTLHKQNKPMLYFATEFFTTRRATCNHYNYHEKSTTAFPNHMKALTSLAFLCLPQSSISYKCITIIKQKNQSKSISKRFFITCNSSQLNTEF